MRLVDLSALVENSLSEPMEINIKRIDHIRGARQFCRNLLWNKRLPFFQRVKHCIRSIFQKKILWPKDFPENAFLSLDIVSMPTHMGTHIDAPYHYGPNKSGQLGDTVEKLPIEWFYQPAVCLDLRHKKPAEYIYFDDIKNALIKSKHKLEPLNIVLICTGTDKLWGTKEYFNHAPGMSEEATAWLVNQGIKVIGVDTYGFDRPFPVMLADFWRTGNKAHLWPAHFYGRNNAYIQIERLINLDKLIGEKFNLACFPLRIKGVDASWIRAVAILN